MKNEIIEDLKWFRDEYISPKQFSSTEVDLDTPARKLLCTMFIEFLEDGKNDYIIKKYQSTFFRLVNQAKLKRNMNNG